MTLNKTALTLEAGVTETLVTTVLPEETTDKTVTFSSSDASIASVTPKQGKVTGVATGTATITAITVDGKTATCEVTVTARAGG